MTTSAPEIPQDAPTRQWFGSARRLAVVLSHPVQYYSPWFRHLSDNAPFEMRVFYLWNPDTTGNVDRKFGKRVQWDIPLFEGYAFEFVPNSSPDPGTHHFSGLDNPGAAERIARWKPDAILLFGYAWKTHLRILLSPSLRSVPLLLRGDSHDLPGQKGPRSIFATRLRRLLFRRFSGFLSVGRAHEDYLRKSGVPGGRIHRCPHAVDNARFRSSVEEAEREGALWKATLGIAPDRPVALFAGKFEEKKRPGDLLDAFLSLDLSSYETRPALLLVGNGELEKSLRRDAGQRTGSDVFFAPFQNQTLMPRTYASGDFLVLPSLGRGETWGLAVNESMNLGRPALVSDHVGCGPDLVIDEVTGWQFTAGDVGNLATKLHSAFSDRVRTRKMGRKAKNHVDSFSYESATRGLVEALQTVVPYEHA